MLTWFLPSRFVIDLQERSRREQYGNITGCESLVRGG
jgi:hypothetical protein